MCFFGNHKKVALRATQGCEYSVIKAKNGNILYLG